MATAQSRGRTEENQQEQIGRAVEKTSKNEKPEMSSCCPRARVRCQAGQTRERLRSPLGRLRSHDDRRCHYVTAVPSLLKEREQTSPPALLSCRGLISPATQPFRNLRGHCFVQRHFEHSDTLARTPLLVDVTARIQVTHRAPRHRRCMYDSPWTLPMHHGTCEE
ncbi:hypothetical protein MTO96_012795 [Rhipicephalus appendiculatus]